MTFCKRRVLTVLSILVLLMMAATAALAASNIPAKDTWRVTASSIQSDEFLPGYLADSDMTTRWSSQAKDEEWALIDLGKVVEITGFTLHWENGYSSKYNLLVSTDAQVWTTVYINDEGDGQMDDIFIRPVSARYVRLDTRERATSWGNSLWEFDIKGTDDIVDISVIAGGGANTRL